MAITNPTIEESAYTNTTHHSNMDKNDANMHHPIGFRGASVGSSSFKDGTGNIEYNILQLPAALGYISSTAAPTTEVSGDIYILNDDSLTYTISAINWQSGDTVRYTFSGTPDLSGIATSTNILYCYDAVNSEHNGRFVITSVNDGSDYIEVTNTLVSDASLDEITGGSCELPSDELDGASNNDYIKFDGTDWYRITPAIGTKCYDKTLGQTRTFNGSLWLGESELIAMAFTAPDGDLAVGDDVDNFHMPYDFYVTSVIGGVVTAPTGSAITLDITDDTTTIFSTLLTIDATEKTSATAATPAVISAPTIAANSIIGINVDVVGSTIAGAGGKIYLIGNRI